MQPLLIIRADANARIGTGHLMRCMALAQSWKTRGAAVTFVTCCESKSLRRRLSDEGIRVVTLEQYHPHQLDWEITSQVMRKSSAAWVVLDGYQFDLEYQNQVKKNGHRLLVIDDTAHLAHYCADIVLNQNIGADRVKYSHEPYTRMMLGSQYALLRSEFLTWRGWKRKIPNVAAKVLVTLGGADYHNATLQAINALKRVNCPDLEVKIVAGASNPNIEMLKGRIVNLHISLLPWNRGAEPNLWSFLEDTPKGVKIHYVDEGLDTGDVLAQKELFLNEDCETLATTYRKLSDAIVNLFDQQWPNILHGKVQGVGQPSGGSFHLLKDKKKFDYLLTEKGWDTPVLELVGKALKNFPMERKRNNGN